MTDAIVMCGVACLGLGRELQRHWCRRWERHCSPHWLRALVRRGLAVVIPLGIELVLLGFLLKAQVIYPPGSGLPVLLIGGNLIGSVVVLLGVMRPQRWLAPRCLWDPHDGASYCDPIDEMAIHARRRRGWILAFAIVLIGFVGWRVFDMSAAGMAGAAVALAMVPDRRS